MKLDDFNLSGALLQEERENIHLFKGYNQLEPIVCSVVTTLKAALNVSIYGMLFYDNKKLSWTL